MLEFSSVGAEVAKFEKNCFMCLIFLWYLFHAIYLEQFLGQPDYIFLDTPLVSL